MHTDTPNNNNILSEKNGVLLGFKSRVYSCNRDVFSDIHTLYVNRFLQNEAEFCKSQN